MEDGQEGAQAGFSGLGVVVFESRRAAEMAALVARHGGGAVSAPTLREVALGDDGDAKAFARALVARAFEVVVAMTGVGTRGLIAAAEPEVPRDRMAEALRGVTVVARGPKPVAALREIGVGSVVVVPEPNTHREVLETMRARGLARAGLRVGLIEHGEPTPELTEPLRAEGVLVRTVRVYRWALVDDTAPLQAALTRIADGALRVALFTSRSQVELALGVADGLGLGDRVRATLRAGVVASIGPVCSEALRAEGLAPDIEPVHPKMGHLVKTAAERAASVLAAKA